MFGGDAARDVQRDVRDDAAAGLAERGPVRGCTVGVVVMVVVWFFLSYRKMQDVLHHCFTIKLSHAPPFCSSNSF